MREQTFSPGSQAAAARIARVSSRKKWWRVFFLFFFFLAFLLLLLFHVFFGLAVVDGNSMSPEFQDGDVILYSRSPGTLQRNDTVLLRTEEGKTQIKRIIGLPGEEVYIDRRTGTVMIDGIQLEEDFGTTLPGTDPDYPVFLGENEYFVLGDNREDSIDSRDYGPISSSRIKGTIYMTLRVGRKNG